MLQLKEPALSVVVVVVVHSKVKPLSEDGLDPSGIVSAGVGTSPGCFRIVFSRVPSGRVTSAVGMLFRPGIRTYSSEKNCVPSGTGVPSGSWQPCGSCVPGVQLKYMVVVWDVVVWGQTLMPSINTVDWLTASSSASM